MTTRRNRRRVRRSHMDALQRLPQGEAWRGYTIGLLAAERLRACFPAFYHAHVGALPLTSRRLLGVVQAFLSLAQQHLELLLAEDLDTNRANPLAVLDPGIDDEDALCVIAECAGRDISEIWPLVYGLDDAEDELFSFSTHPPLLAVVCWALAEQTNWSPVYVEMGGTIATLQRHLYQCRAHPEMLIRLNDLPRLPADIAMELMCDRLSQGEPFHGADLGLVLRYCFHATGNQFADLAYSVVAQMERSNLDWLEEDLVTLGQLQRAAETIADSYHALNARLLADAATLDDLLVRVLSAASSPCMPATTPSANQIA